MGIWHQGTAMSPEAAVAAPFILPVKAASSPLGTSVVIESAAGSAKVKQNVSLTLCSAHRDRKMQCPETRAICTMPQHACMHFDMVYRQPGLPYPP